MGVNLEAERNEPSSTSNNGTPRRTAAEVATCLEELQNLSACAVLDTREGGVARRLAFGVPVGPFSRPKAEARLSEQMSPASLPDEFVLVTKIPRTDQGTVDDAQLLSIPRADDAEAQALEQRLLADDRVAHAAVFVDELPRARPVLHLNDLVGRDFGRSARSSAVSSDAPSDDASEAPPQTQVSSANVPERPLAVSVGESLSTHPGEAETLPQLLEQAAGWQTDARITYIADDGTTTEQTFSELLAEARRIAAGLSSSGFTPGQHALLQLSRANDILPAFWGCLLSGVVPAIAPVPPSYEAATSDLERLCHVLETLDSPLVITREPTRGRMPPLQQRVSLPDDHVLDLEALRACNDPHPAPALNPTDAAFFVLTSGSTGVPKIIMLTHRNILTRSRGTNRLCRHEVSDRILNWLPFDHIGSISDWHLRCVELGCSMFYSSKEYVLGEPLNWLRLTDRFRITHSWAPNFAYALVNEALKESSESWDLSSMKALLTAGEAVSSNTVHEFLQRLAPHGLAKTALRPAFGMAELGSGVTYYQPTDQDPVRVCHVARGELEGPLKLVSETDPNATGFTSLGPVIPGTSMRIVDDQNQPLPELTIGRLQIAGGPVLLGYFKNPEANQQVFTGDGWFNTGDRGFLANGELYLTGRDKESLIINGANFHNSEIEAAVEEVDGVQVSFTAACAVRAPGDQRERLAIFLVPTKGQHALQLGQLLRKAQNSVARKTGTKPDYLLLVETGDIPKTGIGKIQRKALVKGFESGAFDEALYRTDLLLGNERTVPDWFATPSFAPKALEPTARVTGSRSCLILGNAGGLGNEIAKLLEDQGTDVVVCETAADADVPAPAGGAFTDVVHVVGYAPLATPAIPVTARSAAADLLAVTESLVRRSRENAAVNGGSTELRCWVVASHAQAVDDNDVCDPCRAMIPPVLKALQQEAPGLQARHFDFGFASEEPSRERVARQFAKEFAMPNTDDEIIYRGEVRSVPSFERVTWQPLAERPLPLERGAVYLITGGLGGVGAELSRLLLERWNAKLILIGRTAVEGAPPSSNGAPAGTSPRAQALADLRQLGQVDYQLADVTNAESVRQAVERAEAVLGQQLRGIFHLAGVYHEKPIADESPESLEALLGPKVAGTQAVHALAEGRSLAFVASFSSVASVFSGSTIGGYAAANRFVDALAHCQRQAGLPSYSMNWAAWKGLGIYAEGAPAEVIRSKGYHQMGALQGLASLFAGLGRKPAQLIVGVDLDHAALMHLTKGPARPVLGLRGAYVLKDPGQAQLEYQGTDRLGRRVPTELWSLPRAPLDEAGSLDRNAVLAELRGASRQPTPPKTPVQKQLAEIWREVLDLESVGIDQSFFEVGGTSLLSVRLFAEMERKLGISLPPATLFQASTILELCNLIEQAQPEGSVDSVVLLAESAADENIFFVHDEDGSVETYRPLAERLSQHFRVHGIEPKHSERFPSLNTRIEEMSEHVVDRIRAVQPNGPYRLAGFGPGGLVAFEAAAAIARQGERVARLVLFDTPKPPRKQGGPAELAERAAQALKDFLAVPGGDSGNHGDWQDQLKSWGLGQFHAARARLLRRYRDQKETLPWFLEHIPAGTLFRLALGTYVPSDFEGPITVFVSDIAASRGDFSWNGNVELIATPSNDLGELSESDLRRLTEGPSDSSVGRRATIEA